ncbi:hypothetical protein C4K38_0029 [Pseudomonas chlororaphis subsp. piscium]|nr:hypothetical protein C4K38_0029 [Pseudomonas chlororaphis subsp. piscium]
MDPVRSFWGYCVAHRGQASLLQETLAEWGKPSGNALP